MSVADPDPIYLVRSGSIFIPEIRIKIITGTGSLYRKFCQCCCTRASEHKFDNSEKIFFSFFLSHFRIPFDVPVTVFLNNKQNFN